MTPAVASLSADLVQHLADQYVDPRSVPWRYSTLRAMSQSAAHYEHACQTRDDPRLCLRIGAGTHSIMFGEPYVVFTGKVRNGKAWEAFEKEHAGKVILNAREYAQAQAIADAVRRHPEASRYLFASDSVTERRIDWRYLGRDFRSTPDSRSKSLGAVVELKSTRCSEPSKFVRDGGFRGYHVQLATYGDAVEQAEGWLPGEHIIVAVESLPPHPVTVFRVVEDSLERGRRTLRLWAEQALTCEAAGVYPSYTQSIAPFDLGDADDPFTLRINGEDIEVE